MSSGQHGQSCEALFSDVHALNGLEFLKKGWHGVDDNGGRPGQRLHHVSESATGVGHDGKVVFNTEQVDERSDDLLNRESSERVLVAHDKNLAHADHRLQLLAFVIHCLHASKQLLGLRS